MALPGRMRLAGHVAQGDLALGVRSQEGQATVLAQLGLAFHQTVRVVDRRRHQFGGLIAGVAKHQALVTGTGVQMIVRGMVDPLGNVIALFVVGDQYGATFVVDAVVGVVIANAFEGIARHLDVVDMGVGGDFTGQHHQAGVAQGLGGNAGFGVLREDCVENCVRNLIG